MVFWCVFLLFPLPPSPIGCGSLRGAAQSALWLREPHRPAHCAGTIWGHEPHLDHAQSKAGERCDAGRRAVCFDHRMAGPFVSEHGIKWGISRYRSLVIWMGKWWSMIQITKHTNYPFKWFEQWFEPWFNDPFFWAANSNTNHRHRWHHWLGQFAMGFPLFTAIFSSWDLYGCFFFAQKYGMVGFNTLSSKTMVCYWVSIW